MRLYPTKVTSPPPQGPLLFGSKIETLFNQECLAEEYGLFFSFHLDVSFSFISFLNIIPLPSMVNIFVNLRYMFVL